MEKPVADHLLVLVHLEAVRASPPGYKRTAEGIAEATGLPRLRIYRVLRWMRARGLVAADYCMMEKKVPRGTKVHPMVYEIGPEGVALLTEVRDLLRIGGASNV